MVDNRLACGGRFEHAKHINRNVVPSKHFFDISIFYHVVYLILYSSEDVEIKLIILGSSRWQQDNCWPFYNSKEAGGTLDSPTLDQSLFRSFGHSRCVLGPGKTRNLVH